MPDKYGWLDEDEILAELAKFTPQQLQAIRWALKTWVATAGKEGYFPIKEWLNFPAEIDHSALLNRIFTGKRPLEQRPPVQNSYPVYPDD